MAKFWDEKLEGTGYQETWSLGETISGISILDEDYATSSVTGAPSDWDSQCLRCNMDNNDACYVRHNFASSQTISYARVELIWGSFPDGLAQFHVHTLFGIEDSSGNPVWRIYIQERGTSSDGPYRIQFRDFRDGTENANHSSDYTFSLNTRHRIEVKWDGSANEFEFRFDGVTTYSGTITTGPTDIQQDFRLGLGALAGAPGNCEIFYDNIAFSDTDWLGAEDVGEGGSFPEHSAIVETQFSSATTDHNVDLPSTINSGNLIYINFAIGESAFTITTPSGYTNLWQDTRGSFVRGGDYLKVADGTEGGTQVNFVTSGSIRGAAQARVFTSWYGSLNGVEAGSSVNDASDSPDPPSITPSWGALNTMFIAVGMASDDDETVSSWPTNYDDSQTDTIAGGGTDQGTTVMTATRNLNSTSDDPGTFTLTGSESWIANTVAIRPSISNRVILRRRRQYVGVF